jgi:hypothetical protein
MWRNTLAAARDCRDRTNARFIGTQRCYVNLLSKLSGLLFLLVMLNYAAFASVAVTVPVNGAAVSSPFLLSANASLCSSQSIGAMGYSLDSSPNTTVVHGTAVLAAVAAGAGAHTLHVKAWGNQGAVCDTDVAIIVTPATATPGAPSGISINSPANGASVASPFGLAASASTCSSQPVSAIAYWLDNNSAMIANSTSVNAQITAAVGAHTLYLLAWGAQGASCETSVAVTVTSTAPPAGPVVPPNAIQVSSLQALSNWAAVNDTGGKGTSGGTTSMVSSPSLSSNAREFATNFLNSGDERYFVAFGDDTVSNNFLYDGWVYLASPTSDISNLEMDMNQVMANGQTVIFGFQCDGYSGTWDYTANEGTPQKPSDHWLHSNAVCNLSNWAPNTWHHVQISYSRDNAGNVTYQAVWLDGVEQQLNVTVPSAFALGWAPSLLTNIEVDGLGSSGSSTVYLDNLTVYRWVE